MTPAQAELPFGTRNRADDQAAAAADVLERLSERERKQVAARVLVQTRPFSVGSVRDGLSDVVLAKLAKFPNAMGGVFTALARRHLIQKTGRYVHSDRADRRNGESAEWEVTDAGRRAGAEDPKYSLET